MELSIVIPMHNEGPNVRPLLDEIAQACEGRYDYEIVVIDDGSRDETASELKAWRQAGHPRLRILHHARACGQSTAVHSGVHAARAPWIATLDGDGQNDPADIPRLFEAARTADSGTRMVAGMRTKRQDNWLRRLSSRVANAVRSWMLNDATPDSGCGLKVFDRESFLRLPYFDHMHRFLPALFNIYGMRVTNLAVGHRPRLKGISKYGLHNRLWVGIVDLFGVMWLKARSRPGVRVVEE